MNGDINKILQSYGTSLKELKAFFPKLIAESAKKKKAQYPFLNVPKFFTAEEVKGMGLTTETGEPFELEEGWMLKLTPGKNGDEPSFSLKSPIGEEVGLEDVFITEAGEWKTRAEIEAFAEEYEAQRASWEETIPSLYSKLFPEMSEEDLGVWGIEDVQKYATENPEDFLQRVWNIGRTPETEALFKLMGATEERINEIFPLTSEGIATKPLFQMPLGSYALSAQPVEAIAAFAKSDFDAFRQAALFEGRNEKMEALFRQSGWSEKQIDDFYQDNIPGRFVKGEWLPDALEDYWKLYWGGTGDMVGALAGAADRLGVDGVAEAMKQIGLEGRLITIDVSMGEPDSPEWYAKNITRMVPMMLAIIDAGWATGGGGAALVSAAGGGTFLSSAVGIISAGAVSTISEGAMEAGDAYLEAQRRGYSEEECNAVFDEVLRGNAGLLSVTNTAQFAAGFFLPGGRTATFLAKALIFGFETTSEGLEEGVQLAIAREALGDVQAMDEEMWQNVKLGLAGGLGFGTVATIYQSIKSDVQNKLTDEQKALIRQWTGEHMAQGLSMEEAESKAWDSFAETPKGKKIIAETIEEKMAREQEEAKGKFTEIKEKLTEISEKAKRTGEIKKTSQRAKDLAWETIQEQQGIKIEEAEITWPRLTDYLEAQEYNAEKVNKRISEINDLLAKRGKIPSGKGTRTSLEIELARLEALKELASMRTEERLKSAIEEVQTELGNRSMPYHGGAQNLFPEYTTKQLDEILKVYEEVRKGVPLKAVKPTITSQLKDLYASLETEVKAFQAAVKGLTGDEAKLTRETLRGLERELKYVENTLESFTKRPDLPEATVLRSTIMAWAKYKGLTKTQLQEIFSSVAGRRQLRFIPQEHLMEILNRVKAARPKRIRGRTVITPKTENKIQTLKDTLIRNKQLTERSFERLMEQLGLRTFKYESQYLFITESEGKALIRAMNDEAVFAEWDIKVEESLARHPNILKARDDLNARSTKQTEVTFDDKPIRISRGNELRSMRYYVLKLQKELGAPIYDIWQKINMTHLALRQKQQILINKLEASTPQFRAFANDEVALKRVEDYIASKHKMGPKAPANITVDEIALAQELERQLFEFRNDVRYARFMEAYAGHSGDVDAIALDIPDAPKRALRRAADIYEGKGATALREFLDTQEWGVIRSGYNPLSVVKPKLHLYTAKPTSFAKGHIQTRTGTEYVSEDRNILSRYRSYTKQMLALTELSPLIRAFDRVFTEHAHKLADYRPVANVLSRGLNEMKGYREDGGFIIHMLERLYAQVASAVFWRPDLVLRNKFQNFAFNPDYHIGLFLDPRNRFLSPQRRLWFEIFVAQQKGIEQDYLLYSEKPLPGFGRLTNLAHKTSLYPWSDKSNRAECFFVRMNRVDRALAQYRKEGNIKKLIDNSGLKDFEVQQQAEALELLAMDSVDYGIEGLTPVTGEEAFARYNAQQLVNNVHFLYDRAQRAPAEMGASGKTLGNILVFTRSWGERLLLQGNKIIDPKIGIGEKLLALRIIIGIIVAGMLAGEAYKRITGKSQNPYNPLNILSWAPGGLIIGVAEDISTTMYWITEAAQGNETAMGKLPALISNCATLCLPFYKNLVQVIDSLTDMKNIDIYALRKIREMIDDEYEVRGGTHEVERTLLEKIQHALLGGKDKPATSQEKASDAEAKLGLAIEEKDKPFSIEDADIYDMKNLNTDLGRILKGVSSEDITQKNGYSALAEAWVEKEGSERVWETLPNVPLYKINADPNKGDTFEEYYNQWRLPEDVRQDYEHAYLGNFSRRQLDLLREYHSLDSKPKKDAFLEAHPELTLNPRDEWLKENPEDNAKLSLWGQAKILSLEAYNEVKKLAKELDVPDNAIPSFTLPPEGSVENYFKYLELGQEFGYNSAEVKLLMLEDDTLREWLDREPIDTPVESINISVKWRKLDDLYDSYSDKESPNYIKDDEERAEAREKLLTDNPEYADDRRRRDAYSIGLSEALIEDYVEWYKTPRKGHLDDWFLIEHRDFYNEMVRLEQLEERDLSKVPDIKYKNLWSDWIELDEQWDAYGDKDSDDYVSNEAVRELKRNWLLWGNPEYAQARRKREALELGFPEELLDTYVEYYWGFFDKEQADRDTFEDMWFEDDWWLMEHPEFEQAMLQLFKDSAGKYGWENPIDYSLVPSREVWQLYKEYKGTPAGEARIEFRRKHPDLDAWLVAKFNYRPVSTHAARELPSGEEEEKPEDVEEWGEEWVGEKP